ncbi:MAG: hypothetical protein COS94_06585 [Candidatus Hydrogenedentes bacterium CG07_land_8_20_14_0_80_42_17]|nr:MAG: hypothetical protein COS94_06585 [Candidatus Hydrogenedentes bacterium CG07_land_8_20_14_0_80_42_17]
MLSLRPQLINLPATQPVTFFFRYSCVNGNPVAMRLYLKLQIENFIFQFSFFIISHVHVRTRKLIAQK